MIFHENRLLADDSREISCLNLSKTGKDVANLSSAEVVIGALRVKRICWVKVGKYFYTKKIKRSYLSSTQM